MDALVPQLELGVLRLEEPGTGLRVRVVDEVRRPLGLARLSSEPVLRSELGSSGVTTTRT